MLVLGSCTDENQKEIAELSACFSDTHTILLPFSNDISSDTLSVFDYHYLYNGGGVGIADFNDDGNKDIFLGGNLVSSALLIGDGKLGFQDLTSEAGLHTSSWVNGVSIVDINHDGKEDIYLSVGGPGCDQNSCNNLLYINNSSDDQINFVESAESYGLNIPLYSQQGLFIDVDMDGDLDLYQLQNHVDPTTKNYPKPKQYFSKDSYDKLLINQEVETGKVSFIDQSAQWGVQLPGFGLGIVSTDFNGDGYPDIYVANDFITDDILYINVAGQKFVDQSKDLLKHTSYNSMGVDVGDINGDALADIMVVDMLPYDNHRQKTMLGSMNYDKFLLSQKENYNNQFIRNTLQLSTGSTPYTISSFTDAAAFYKVHDTDWSWSPLIMDFDNDQHNDIFVSNGYGKNITDLDFVNYNSNLIGFGDKSKIEEQIKKDVSELPDVKLPNHLYLNTGEGFKKNMSFKKTITNGVAYSDLDNDGDLDLVLNNLNDYSSILENNSTNNYLKIKLTGPNYNKKAIGAQISVTLNSGKKILRDLSPVRSYLSSMDTELVIGLGKDTVQKLAITWPDNRKTMIDSVLCNQTFYYSYNSDTNQNTTAMAEAPSTYKLETIVTKSKRLIAAHDFSIQPLLFKSCQNENIKLARIKNKVAVANTDQGIYLISEDNAMEKIFDLQKGYATDVLAFDLTRNGKEEILIAKNNRNSDTEISVLEEKDQTWQVASTRKFSKGEYRFHTNKDKLYLSKFPNAATYPQGDGAQLLELSWDKSELVTKDFSLELDPDVCITDVVFSDLNQDGLDDLVIVGEWMPVTIFWNSNAGYKNKMEISHLRGMWQEVTVGDLDDDGDVDILLANLGCNSRLKASQVNPLSIVCSDLDNNGSIDPMMSLYNPQSNTYYSYSSRDDIAKKLPTIKQNYNDYNSFAKASFSELLSSFEKKPEIKQINILESVMLENKGPENFEIISLPPEAQLSIINNFQLVHYNEDALLDIVALTNNEDVEIHNGNLDGLNCLVLLNEGKMQFSTIPNAMTGLNISEPTEDIVRRSDGSYLISSSKAVYSLNKL